MKLEGNGPEIPSGEIAKLVTAATQVAGQLRQIKILVLIYAVASLSLCIGAIVYSAATFSLPAESDHEPRESEAVTADDEAEPAGPSENDPLPSINLRDADGRVWSDRDLDGKAVLLNFWTTWCAPCRREMPIFDEMQEIYGSKGFAVLAISLDRGGWDVVRPYIAELDLSYPIFVADESVERGFGRITAFPTTYFVRRDGTIDAKHVGGLSRSHIVRHIESLLGIKSAERTDAAVAEGPPSAQSETVDRSTPAREGRPDHDTGLPTRTGEARVRDIDEFSPPKMLDFSAPRLTKELMDADGKVSVDVEARVDADGSVHDVKVVRGVSMEMDERVVEAVKRTRFEPAKKAGKPISMRMRLSIRLDVNRVVRPYDPEE